MTRNPEVSQLDFGVPRDFAGRGVIRCKACGRAYRDHNMMERCRDTKGAFDNQLLGERHAIRKGVTFLPRNTGIPHGKVHLP